MKIAHYRGALITVDFTAASLPFPLCLSVRLSVGRAINAAKLTAFA